MSEPWEWNIEDVRRLIADRVRESLALDYKASPSLARSSEKIMDLTKDVSAFANSAGGTLVYGVTEDEQHYPQAIDSGLDPSEIGPDWLSQILDSRVSPRIRGYRIRAVDRGEGRVLYVIYVPQSDTAHMADDNRYYRRSDSRSIPMEDYEVRDVMRRAQTPDVRLEFVLSGGATRLHVTAHNYSPVAAPYFVGYLYVGEHSGIKDPTDQHHFRKCHASAAGREIDCEGFQFNYLGQIPIMEGVPTPIMNYLTFTDWPAFQFFAWETVVPGRTNRLAYLGTDSHKGQLVPWTGALTLTRPPSP